SALADAASAWAARRSAWDFWLIWACSSSRSLRACSSWRRSSTSFWLAAGGAFLTVLACTGAVATTASITPVATPPRRVDFVRMLAPPLSAPPREEVRVPCGQVRAGPAYGLGVTSGRTFCDGFTTLHFPHTSSDLGIGPSSGSGRFSEAPPPRCSE